MPSRHDLPNYLPSPARRAPTQEFDYQELVADPKFHAVVDEHKKNGSFAELDEGSPEFNLRLREIAVAFVGVINEKRATLFRNRGILNGRRGAFREAISCYNRALELSNNSPSRHVTLANRSAAYIKSQKFAEALEDAQEAALLCCEYSIAHSLMGYCHSRLGMDKKAVVNYNTALQLNPRDVSSQGLLAEVKKSLISAGETVETIEALEAPFVAVRDQEAAAIQAAIAAAHEVPAMRKTYLDSAERAGSIAEMVKKAGMPIDAGCKTPERDSVGQNSTGTPSPAKNGTQKQKRLSRKLSSGSAQAFASLTKIPGKLKHALGKKNRASSSLKGYGPGQHLGSDFPGLYQNVVEDAAGAIVPASCQGVELAADAPRGASNPLFCADRHRHGTSANSAPGGLNPSSVSGVAVGIGSGGRAAGVFCATEPSAGGPIIQSSRSGSGGDPAVLTRRDTQRQRRQLQERSQNQGLPPETPPRAGRAQNPGEQPPEVQHAVALQQERSRRETNECQEKEGRPSSVYAAAEDSGGGATASLTPPSAPEDDSVRPSSCPPAPRLGLVQEMTSAEMQTTPRTGLQQEAPAVQIAVRRDTGTSWAPEKSGYASSDSEFSEGSPLRSRAVEADATICGGEDRVSSTLPNETTERDQILGPDAATVVMAAGRQPTGVRSSEKAGCTTSGSISAGDVGGGVAKESGGDRVRLDVYATNEILMRDEEGIAAERALRIGLDGESDCGSVHDTVTGIDGGNTAVEGETTQQAAITQTQTFNRMELLQAVGQASSGKRFTQSLGGGATAQDRLSAGEEGGSVKHLTQSVGGGLSAFDRRSADREGGARGFPPAAVGDIASSMFADAAEPESSARLSVSVRAKIEMFERTALSLAGEEAKLKDTMGRMSQSRGLSRSRSEKFARKSAISVATTSEGPGHLSRSQSCQPPGRASPPQVTMATTEAHVTDNVFCSRGSQPGVT